MNNRLGVESSYYATKSFNDLLNINDKHDNLTRILESYVKKNATTQNTEVDTADFLKYVSTFYHINSEFLDLPTINLKEEPSDWGAIAREAVFDFIPRNKIMLKQFLNSGLDTEIKNNDNKSSNNDKSDDSEERKNEKYDSMYSNTKSTFQLKDSSKLLQTSPKDINNNIITPPTTIINPSISSSISKPITNPIESKSIKNINPYAYTNFMAVWAQTMNHNTLEKQKKARKLKKIKGFIRNARIKYFEYLKYQEYLNNNSEILPKIEYFKPNTSYDEEVNTQEKLNNHEFDIYDATSIYDCGNIDPTTPSSSSNNNNNNNTNTTRSNPTINRKSPPTITTNTSFLLDPRIAGALATGGAGGGYKSSKRSSVFCKNMVNSNSHNNPNANSNGSYTGYINGSAIANSANGIGNRKSLRYIKNNNNKNNLEKKLRRKSCHCKLCGGLAKLEIKTMDLVINNRIAKLTLNEYDQHMNLNAMDHHNTSTIIPNTNTITNNPNNIINQNTIQQYQDHHQHHRKTFPRMNKPIISDKEKEKVNSSNSNIKNLYSIKEKNGKN